MWLFSTILVFVAVVKGLSVPGVPTTTTSLFNLTASPKCDMAVENVPEFIVPGQTNLYWTWCISTPVTQLSSRLAAGILNDLLYYMSQHLQPLVRLDKYRYRRAGDGRGRQFEFGIRPSAVGHGPHQRIDNTWFITNEVALKIIEQLQGFLEQQFADMAYTLEMFVYEKNIPGHISRGSVATGALKLYTGAAGLDDDAFTDTDDTLVVSPVGTE